MSMWPCGEVALEEFTCKTCPTILKVGDKYDIAFRMCDDPWNICQECYDKYLNSHW